MATSSTGDSDAEVGDDNTLVSASELQMLHETFQLFDKDGDGCITTEELGIVLRCIGQSPSAGQLKEMLHRIDKDGNGTIELEEFIELMKSEKRLAADSPTDESDNVGEEDELMATFRVFDKDKNGFISASELKHVLMGLGHECDDNDVEEMLKEVDVNGDGQVDYAEFTAMLNNPVPSPTHSQFSSIADDPS